MEIGSSEQPRSADQEILSIPKFDWIRPQVNRNGAPLRGQMVGEDATVT